MRSLPPQLRRSPAPLGGPLAAPKYSECHSPSPAYHKHRVARSTCLPHRCPAEPHVGCPPNLRLQLLDLLPCRHGCISLTICGQPLRSSTAETVQLASHCLEGCSNTAPWPHGCPGCCSIRGTGLLTHLLQCIAQLLLWHIGAGQVHHGLHAHLQRAHTHM